MATPDRGRVAGAASGLSRTRSTVTMAGGAGDHGGDRGSGFPRDRSDSSLSTIGSVMNADISPSPSASGKTFPRQEVMKPGGRPGKVSGLAAMFEGTGAPPGGQPHPLRRGSSTARHRSPAGGQPAQQQHGDSGRPAFVPKQKQSQSLTSATSTTTVRSTAKSPGRRRRDDAAAQTRSPSRGSPSPRKQAQSQAQSSSQQQQQQQQQQHGWTGRSRSRQDVGTTSSARRTAGVSSSRTTPRSGASPRTKSPAKEAGLTRFLSRSNSGMSPSSSPRAAEVSAEADRGSPTHEPPSATMATARRHGLLGGRKFSLPGTSSAEPHQHPPHSALARKMSLPGSPGPRSTHASSPRSPFAASAVTIDRLDLAPSMRHPGRKGSLPCSPADRCCLEDTGRSGGADVFSGLGRKVSSKPQLLSREDQAAVTIQAAWRGMRTRERVRKLRRSDARLKSAYERVRAVREMVQHERAYVNLLASCCVKIIAPLRDAANHPHAPLSQQEIRQMFLNMESIVDANRMVADELERKAASPDKNDMCFIGSVFLKMFPLLRMHIDYVNKREESMAVITDVLKREKMAQFLRELADTDPEIQSTDIDTAFLIQPVQRIMRYPMYLERVLKETPPSHRGYTALKQALSKARDLAGQANEAQASVKNNRVMFAVVKRFVNGSDLIAAHRRHIRDGGLMDTANRNHMFFLFSDQLVVAAAQFASPKLAVRARLELASTTVRDLPSTLASHSHTFMVSDSEQTFTVAATTAAEKAAWMRDLTNAIAETAAKGLSFNDVMRWRSVLTRADPEAPPALHRHTVTAIDARTLVVFGGADPGSGVCSNAVYAYNTDGNVWRRIKTRGPAPEARERHTAVLLHNSIIVFGGRNSEGDLLGDVHALRVSADTTWTWEPLTVTSSSAPTARCGHTACVSRNAVIVFAGRDDHGFCNDTWRCIYDPDRRRLAWSLIDVRRTSPEARAYHAACVGVGGNRDLMYVFGGSAANKLFNDLAVFDVNTLTWSTADAKGVSPSKRYAHTLTATTDARLIVFGGATPTQGGLSDVYAWSGGIAGVWTPINVSSRHGPRPRSYHAAAMLGPELWLLGGSCHDLGFTDIFSLDTSFKVGFHVGLSPSASGAIGPPAEPRPPAGMTATTRAGLEEQQATMSPGSDATSTVGLLAKTTTELETMVKSLEDQLADVKESQKQLAAERKRYETERSKVAADRSKVQRAEADARRREADEEAKRSKAAAEVRRVSQDLRRERQQLTERRSAAADQASEADRIDRQVDLVRASITRIHAEHNSVRSVRHNVEQEHLTMLTVAPLSMIDRKLADVKQRKAEIQELKTLISKEKAAANALVQQSSRGAVSRKEKEAELAKQQALIAQVRGKLRELRSKPRPVSVSQRILSTSGEPGSSSSNATQQKQKQQQQGIASATASAAAAAVASGSLRRARSRSRSAAARGVSRDRSRGRSKSGARTPRGRRGEASSSSQQQTQRSAGTGRRRRMSVVDVPTLIRAKATLDEDTRAFMLPPTVQYDDLYRQVLGMFALGHVTLSMRDAQGDIMRIFSQTELDVVLRPLLQQPAISSLQEAVRIQVSRSR